MQLLTGVFNSSLVVPQMQPYSAPSSDSSLSDTTQSASFNPAYSNTSYLHAEKHRRIQSFGESPCQCFKGPALDTDTVSRHTTYRRPLGVE